MYAKHFYTYLSTFVVFAAIGAAHASTVATPRSATHVVNVATGRGDTQTVTRGGDSTTTVMPARAAATRRPSATVSRTATITNALQKSRGRTATVPVASTRQAVPSITRQRASSVNTASVSGAATSRAAATSVVRSAVPAGASTARSAKTPTGASRASTARATAVFNDISKIGGGYAACREAYATCMDQFCALANDTYRRCFCSARFSEFRDTENALQEAAVLLARFEDNNLNAVNMTAAEVEAMYSATVGEAAIKNDTSGAAAILSEIGDLLSGKKKSSGVATSNTSITSLEVDGLFDVGDIWGDSNDATSLFGGGDSSTDMTKLEGEELFKTAEKQCIEIMGDACESTAAFNMSKSAYGIMISQDCNAYEKKIEANKEKVTQTVRQAEKYLREARLEEYRSHNSADVNECLDKVRTALLAETACGANYKRCLDPTGAFINQTTGEPIYSQRLFQLNNVITLNGVGADVLAQNQSFNSFLESKKMFATTALDSCRDIANTVWEEFKRSALIEIAQAQDEKIEEVKMSCVTTMKECYDAQSGALKSFDDTTAQVSGALGARAAQAMCKDKVNACASLYGDPTACEFDGNGKLKSGTGNSKGQCGLQALLDFVNSVDDTRIAEGCDAALDSYLKDLCTPTTGDKEWPWKCRTKTIGKLESAVKEDTSYEDSLAGSILYAAKQYCDTGITTYDKLNAQMKQSVDSAWENVRDALEGQMQSVCTEVDGYWISKEYNPDKLAEYINSAKDYSSAFYGAVFNGNKESGKTIGICVENSVRTACLDYNTDTETVASYDLAKDECTFTDTWYERQCASIGGYYENAMCYVAK